jgi:site-specific DNA recombinase
MQDEFGAVDLRGLVVGRYTRISDDVEGIGAGIARQLEDETKFITRMGGEPGPEYPENDTSAYKRTRHQLPDGTLVWRVVRPWWTKLLADLRSGAIHAACVYDLDRLARDPRDLEDAIELVEHYRRPIVGVTGGFSLLNDNGRFAARILVAQANKSSADTSRRVARKHVDLQQAGVPLNIRRAYGWESDKRTLKPDEADELRRAVERITGGWPAHAVVADMIQRGVKPVMAEQWTLSSLVWMLRNPRLCGIRSREVKEFDPAAGVTRRKVEMVLDADGEPVKGQWEPLITRAEWEAVNAAMTSRAEKKAARTVGDNQSKYVLSGIARCGECGKSLRGNSQASRKSGNYPAFVYQCHSVALGGCGRVGRNGPKTDLHVIEAVLAKLELELADATAEASPWESRAELAEVTQDIKDLTAAWKASPKRISSARYFALLPDLETRERRLLAERGRYEAAAKAIRNRPASIRAEWPDYPLARKRSLIEEELYAVIVHKAPRKGAPFDPELLELVWRQD